MKKPSNSINLSLKWIKNALGLKSVICIANTSGPIKARLQFNNGAWKNAQIELLYGEALRWDDVCSRCESFGYPPINASMLSKSLTSKELKKLWCKLIRKYTRDDVREMHLQIKKQQEQKNLQKPLHYTQPSFLFQMPNDLTKKK